MAYKTLIWSADSTLLPAMLRSVEPGLDLDQLATPINIIVLMTRFVDGLKRIDEGHCNASRHC